MRESVHVFIRIIKFRAPEHEDLALQEVLMKGGVRCGRAVGCDEEVRILEKRGCGGNKPDLDRPVGKF